MAKILSGDWMWKPPTATTIQFRRVRQLIARELRIDESLIQPETRLAAIVPTRRRTEIMWRIAHDNQPPPSKRFPTWISRLLRFIVSAILTTLCFLEPWCLLLLSIVISVMIANIVRHPQSTAWPIDMQTVEDLAIRQAKYSQADAALGLWPKQEIAAKVRWIIANHTGQRFEDISDDTRIFDL